MRDDATIALAANGPLVVAGLFQTASGIGESARLCADALERAGHDILRVDLSPGFHQVDLPGVFQAFPRDRVGTVILHMNPPEQQLAFRLLKLYRQRRWRIIGYWAWEFEIIPEDWAHAAKFLTEIWTPSAFTTKAVSQQIDIPIRTVPHAVCAPREISSTAFADGTKDNVFTVLAMADGRSSLERKNISGAIECFRNAFDQHDNCRLIVKTRNLDEFPDSARALRNDAENDPRIIFTDQSMTNTERWALLHRADCYLSLHRSEGFGLTIAEAMALGKPVITTGWSGNMEFTNSENATLCAYELIEAHDPSGVYQAQPGRRWAAPSIKQACEGLRTLYANKDARTRVGEAGKATIATLATGQQYIDALAARG